MICCLQATEIGVTPVRIGILLGSVSLLQFTCFQLIGFFSHRMHLKAAILMGTTLMMCRSLGLAFPSQEKELFFWSSLGLQVMEGIGSALSSTAVTSSLLTNFPDRASRLQVSDDSLHTTQKYA